MKVAVACGGTGGHVFPGLAVAEALRDRGHDVVLWLAGRDVENVSAGDWDGATVRIKARGFQTGAILGAVGVAWRLVKAVACSYGEMRKNRPDVILAMGSYASVGPVLAARLLHVPVVLHEANVVPGRAISFLSRFARVVAVAFQDASLHISSDNVVVTGFPLRRRLTGSFDAGLLDEDLFTVLVMGGSQGARRLNEVATEALCALHAKGFPVQVVHLSGRNDETGVRRQYEEAGVPSLVFGFLDEMGKAYAAADIAISRSGAASCTELSACGVPSLLVPLPSARRDHQRFNAEVLQRAGGADVVTQPELTPEWLADYIEDCRQNPEKLLRMREGLSQVAVPDATLQLANLVEETPRRPSSH
ncbi:MAG: undecaprenyldiphospho-muramoylpentapeptide beta-N-acetylglucosaminyltransferase [Kiritimatiellia bacterium]|nr:undecaprenyldiphospho-muramoylpentapeptide beta-N-acetylglucosaminyltransferase [Kiritimatiellia bacterium]MDP6848674.1 undecaprenyldiphospho-muramoylpentapeptide beta-N-acetylglucosaminyltransferase [Kiritimatiellia bacterium]